MFIFWLPSLSLCFRTVVLEKTLESPLDSKEIKPVNPKGNQPWRFTERTDGWSWSTNTLATWCKELTHWKRPWCWERLTAGGEGGNRGRDGWMASLTQWMCLSLSKLQEIVKDREAWHAAVHGIRVRWLSDWTTTTKPVLVQPWKDDHTCATWKGKYFLCGSCELGDGFRSFHSICPTLKFPFYR